MADDDLLRRLVRFKSKPSASGKSDVYLMAELTNALDAFLQYCHRTDDPGEPIDTLIVDIAVISVNMAGAEGSSSASEGGISRSWDGMPSSLQSRINAWRLPVGL